LLADNGAQCSLFGGWAEELLGLRPPGPHQDIDLVHQGEDFSAIERMLRDLPDLFREIAEKRFNHKRAFLYRGGLCEVFLIQNADRTPFTMFWGDVRFDWGVPLLSDRPLRIKDRTFGVTSERNLRKYRDERSKLRPHRWADPASLIQ
jgi:hypothetical protein